MATVMEDDRLRSLPPHVMDSSNGRRRRLPRPHHLMTLVLNADFQPLWTWPLSQMPASDAISKVWMDKINVVETWQDAFGNDIVFRSPSITIPVPKVVVLREYVCVHGHPKFNRKNVLLRDRYCCQYCGKKFPSSELTYDHLIPKSKGGKTEWTNIVMACEKCNGKKANKMPEFSGRKGTKHGNGLRPLKMPKIPTNAELLKAGLDLLPHEVKQDFASWLYWNVELEE